MVCSHGRLTARLGFAFVFICAGFAAPAFAQPVDLSDPTSRTIHAQVDLDTTDYASIGAAYGAALEAQFEVNGTTATVTIPAAGVIALLEDFFLGFAVAVPGTFSDFVVEIDTVTLEVLTADVSGTVQIPILGNLQVNLNQTASSTDLAGFELIDLFGLIVPSFCTATPTCTIVPGLPYDPDTGMLNAVGQIASGLGTFFTPFGDLKLSEIPLAVPTVDLTLTGPNGATPNTRVTLAMTQEVDPVAWLWAIVVDGTILWVTPSGLSTNPALLIGAPPIDAPEIVLLDAPLPSGIEFGSIFLLFDGTSVIASDAEAILIP